MKETFAIGQSGRTPDGGYLSVVEKSKTSDFQIPGSTARHEGHHMSPNPENVRGASINPKGDSLGQTELITFDPNAALRPHKKGMGGTGWDRYITVAHGYSENSGSDGDAEEDELAYVFAGVLEARKVMGHWEIQDVAHEVKHGKEVSVFYTPPSGETQIQKQNVEWSVKRVEVVMEPNKEYEPELALAA